MPVPVDAAEERVRVPRAVRCELAAVGEAHVVTRLQHVRVAIPSARTTLATGTCASERNGTERNRTKSASLSLLHVRLARHSSLRSARSLSFSLLTIHVPRACALAISGEHTDENIVLVLAC